MFAGSLARAGRIETAHGIVHTPALTVAATKATVKALAPEDLHFASPGEASRGKCALMCNTYHLYLQPGDEVIKKAGGLHKFMSWQGPIWTDSGGFQAFSLGEALGRNISKFTSWDEPEPRGLKTEKSRNLPQARIDDDGVTFYSHIDGSEQRFTPERSIQIQPNLGADIILAFDECVSPHAPREAHEKAVERTKLWAERSMRERARLQADNSLRVSSEKIPRNVAVNHPPSAPSLWGIVQGGRYEDLRRRSAKEIAALGRTPRSLGGVGFDGFGIGGSFAKEDMGTAVRWVCEELPEDKPRHLLGVGEPEDIFAAVENGVDTFDCVAATRKARNGQLYTHKGEINITSAKFKELFEAVDRECGCSTCRNYTAAYLHHLFKSSELLAYRLASIHNLFFIINLTKQIRLSIFDNTFHNFKSDFLNKFGADV